MVRMLALTLPVTLCACAEQAAPPQLAASRWHFVSIDGARPTSRSAALSFEDDALAAELGCTALGGPWRVQQDRIVAGPLDQSEVRCTARAWDQEKAVGALLSGLPRYAVEGDRMVLRSRGHVAELRRARPHSEI